MSRIGKIILSYFGYKEVLRLYTIAYTVKDSKRKSNVCNIYHYIQDNNYLITNYSLLERNLKDNNTKRPLTYFFNCKD